MMTWVYSVFEEMKKYKIITYRLYIPRSHGFTDYSKVSYTSILDALKYFYSLHMINQFHNPYMDHMVDAVFIDDKNTMRIYMRQNIKGNKDLNKSIQAQFRLKYNDDPANIPIFIKTSSNHFENILYKP